MGSLNNAGTVDVENGSTLTINGAVDNSGNLYTNQQGIGGKNTLNITGMLTNEAGGNFTLYGPMDSATLGSLSNAGTVNVDKGSTLTILGDASNSGTIATDPALSGNIVNVGGMLTNSGTFTLNGPNDVATLGSLNNAGTVNVDNGSTLNVTGAASNSGTIQTDPGGNTITVTGLLTNEAGGTFTLNGPMDTGTLGSLNNAGLVGVGNGSTLMINGTVNNTWQFFVVGAGSVATMTGLANSVLVDAENGGTLQINGAVDNSGLLATNYFGTGGGNTVNITGTLTNELGAIFQLSGPTDMATLGSLNNSGTVNVNGGSTLTVTHDATNSGDIFTDPGSNKINIGGMLTNSGTFQLNGPTDMAMIGNGMGTALANSGYVDVDGGSTLTIKGAVDNFGELLTDDQGNGGSNTITITGALTNEATGTFQLNGPTDMATIGNGMGTALANSGNVNVFGSTLMINGDATNSGTLTEGTFVTCGLHKTCNSPGTVTIGGNLTNSVSGKVDLVFGSTLTISGNFDNSGMLETGNGPHPAGGADPGGNTVTVTGLLTNEATGLINLTRNDVLQALAGLSNNGVINVNGGSTIDPPFVNNGGTINIGPGSKMIVGTGMAMGTGYIQLANGTLGEIINGYGPCGNGNCGLITVNGSALLAGALDIMLKAGFNPTVGSEFTILTASKGQLSGSFTSILNECFNNNTECWGVTYDYADGLLDLTANPNGNPVPEPATLLVLIPGLMAAGYGLRRRLSK